MRLTEFEIENIKNLARLHFGNNVQVFLFGSRTDNKMRGGDIDLFIRDGKGNRLTVRSKINFVTDLILKIGEQKIDVVLENNVKEKTDFLKTIHKTALQLC